MRLWHKDLIKVLPRQQLLSQWRECCCIARNISVNGTPNHILVNKMLEYPISHFHYYSNIICEEMERRGYKCDYSRFDKWCHLESNNCTYSELYEGWHNKRYMIQCFRNIQEKYDCGGVPEEEYKILEEYVHEFIYFILSNLK